MKRAGNLWPRVIGDSNLYRAYCLARRGKQDRQQVAAFSLNLEYELRQLKRDLVNGSYVPGGYRQFWIADAKPRLISAAPFRDRVVHQAVMAVIEPVLDKSFIYHSYACRKGKGVHTAVTQYQKWAQRYAYVMKLDIRGYFHSIQHKQLKEILARKIKDGQIMWLLNTIVDSSPSVPMVSPETGRDKRGMPIGNLTSQVFANLYLDRLDHWICEESVCPAYMRYVDDLILLGDDKAILWQTRDCIAKKLESLGLSLHPDKQQIYRTDEPVDMLGYRVSKTRRWLRNHNGYRAQRRLKRLARSYAKGRYRLSEVRHRVAAWLGHVQWVESQGLLASILPQISFKRQ